MILSFNIMRIFMRYLYHWSRCRLTLHSLTLHSGDIWNFRPLINRALIINNVNQLMCGTRGATKANTSLYHRGDSRLHSPRLFMETIVGTRRFGNAFHDSVRINIAFVSSIDLKVKALEILGHIVQVGIE